MLISKRVKGPILSILSLSFILCAGDTTSISLSANGRYFVDGNGAPVFWLGDTQWELFRVLSVADASSLMQTRAGQGFRMMQVMLTGVPPEYSSISGRIAWTNGNPLTPNESYFTHIDSIVTAAHACGMVLVIGVYHAKDADAGRITAPNARQWAAWLAQRYKNSPNIIWSMYPHAEQASATIARATAQGLFDGDSGAHLITMHPDPSPTSSSFMHSETWLSFNTYQTWASEYINYTMGATDYARTPIKPVVNGEARYEGESGITASQVRHGAYWSMMSGAFYSYGHGGNWESPSTWSSWINSTGALQMKALAELFRSLSWWKLIPDQSVISGSVGENVAARSSDGDWVLAYLPTNASVTVKLDKITSSDSATAWWVDPLTGNRTTIGTYGTSGTRAFTAPNGWQDAVLLVEQKGGVTIARNSIRPAKSTEYRSSRMIPTVLNGCMTGNFPAGRIANIRGQMLSAQNKRQSESHPAVAPGVRIGTDVK